MERQFARDRVRDAFAIALSIVAISVLHYVTSLHSVVLHEVFQRLYYVPIVIAAVTYGLKAGLATSGFATALYVPHIVLDWGGPPALQLDKYGEVLLFNIVAAVTGLLADRLRAERNRYRRASEDLEAANRELVARTDERILADRLVTVGRLASGIAHEVRNPLGALLGCLEVLEQAPGLVEKQHEFLGLARKEIDRVNRVVGDFLEFACPASAAPASNDLSALVESAVRLAQPNLACRGVQVEVDAPGMPVLVHADAEQLQRAIMNLLLDRLAPPGPGTVRLSIRAAAGVARCRIEIPGVADLHRLVGELFEPFPEHGNGHGLSLAIARRLIENQGGRVRAEADGNALRYQIDLPLRRRAVDLASLRADARTEPLARSA